MAGMLGDIQVANLAGMFQQGQQASQEDRKRGALSKFLQPAMAGDKSAISGLYGAGAGQEAMQAQQYGQKQQGDARDELGKVAAAYAQTKNPQLYGRMRELTAAAGINHELPQTLDDPADQDGSLQFATAIAQAYGGGVKGQEQFTLAPGSARYGADGKLIVEQPFAPVKPKYQMYDSADGPVWLPEPTGAPQPSAGPSGGAAGLMDSAYNGASVNPVQDFQSLASGFPGAQVSSLARSPEHNAKVGGVPNSYHVKGQAGDFVVPPAERQAFIAKARSMGYDAIDEGDHVHVEPRRGAKASSSFAAGQGINAIPIGGVRPKPKAADKPSELERKLEIAREMGATPEQLKQMVIGKEGAAAGAKPMPVGALKEDIAIEEALGGSERVMRVMAKHLTRIGKGELEISKTGKAAAGVRTFFNSANANDVNYNELIADRTQIVNDSLLLNKGVQTEGDAQRAVAALMASDDQASMVRAMKRLIDLNKQAMGLQQRKRQLIHRNYGQQPQQQVPAAAADDDALIGKYL